MLKSHKKLILFSVIFLFLLFPFKSFAYEWIHIIDGGFMQDYALVQRTDKVIGENIYLVDFMGLCTEVTSYQEGIAIWDGGYDLSGVGDSFIVINDFSRQPTECNVSNAFPVDEIERELRPQELGEFYRSLQYI